MTSLKEQLKNLSGNRQIERTCSAVLVPDGRVVVLEEGAMVYIMQAKGTSVTVEFNGQMLMIGDIELDALGLTFDSSLYAHLTDSRLSILDQAWLQLKTCYDPEIPVNIVDLGLIYHCQVNEETEGVSIRVVMTLTAPGCGMGPVLMEEARRKLYMIEAVKQVDVELVLDPPWSQMMMSDIAKLELGLL
tara:strand:- start:138 stop:704 length:567 start_codon:yes stop_codon:yes gene_type:complete